MGAEKDGYGAVVFAIILSYVLLIVAALLSIPLKSFGISGLVALAIVAFIAIAYAFSKVLVTTFLQGFGIAIFGVILGTIMAIVFTFVLGAGIYLMPYNDEVSVAAFEEVNEEICKCGTDVSCMEGNILALARLTIAMKDITLNAEETNSVQQSSARGQACMDEPADYVATNKKNASTFSASEFLAEGQGSNLSAEPETATAPVKKVVYAWRKANVEELPNLLGQHVKIVTTEDLDRNGKIENIDEEYLYVKKSANLSYSVPRNKIKTIDVYEQME